MITIAYDMKQGNVQLKDTTLAAVAKWFDEQHMQFVKSATLVHRKSVFEILVYLIRVCPVDTGRFRGSWAPFLDKYGQIQRALKWANTQSPMASSVQGERQGFDAQEFARGKSEGDYIDEAFSTTLTSNVNYAEEVNKRTGFISAAQVWGVTRYNRNFERFYGAAQKQGMIPVEDDSSVDPSVESD